MQYWSTCLQPQHGLLLANIQCNRTSMLYYSALLKVTQPCSDCLRCRLGVVHAVLTCAVLRHAASLPCVCRRGCWCNQQHSAEFGPA